MAGESGIIELAKATNPPAALLVMGGAYAGPMSKGFPEEFVHSAGLVSTMAMVVGFLLLVVTAIAHMVKSGRKQS